jgi:VWFA-related protein
MRLGVLLLVAMQATFSVRTEMVVLPVTVTDTRGESVAGLTAADFRVYDDGRLQPITLFRSGEVALTVGLVVDHSQSMRSKLSAVNAAIAAFAGAGLSCCRCLVEDCLPTMPQNCRPRSTRRRQPG